MITFLNLGKKGNLGNQLFQIASTIGIAKRNNQDFSFPSWQFSDYFDFTFKTCDNLNFKRLEEKKYRYHTVEALNGDFNLNGWFQTEQYFENSNIKSVFKFKQHFEESLLEKYSYLFSKKNILITIRRGDFVNNPIFFQLNYKYYLTALLVHFEKLEEYNLIFASDNISYCKSHFSFLDNAFFLENLSPIEQLCLGSKFDNYIISNSTFSWWMAWLGENKNTKIIRPIHAFDGEYLKKNDDCDYFPKRWIIHDHGKLKLSNTYFRLKTYAYFYSSIERGKYVYKVNKKHLKNRVKKIINYK